MIKLSRKPCPNPEALKTDYKNPVNKKALKDSTNNKCMYCESKITHIDYGDVEHIKPKSTFPNEKYNWDNLGFACIKCNRENKLEKYSTDFIDPFIIDPENHLDAVGGIIISVNGSTSGSTTIDIVKLNRTELLEKRYCELIEFQNLIEKYNLVDDIARKEAIKEQLIIETKNDKEYSLSKKSFLKANNII